MGQWWVARASKTLSSRDPLAINPTLLAELLPQAFFYLFYYYYYYLPRVCPNIKRLNWNLIPKLLAVTRSEGFLTAPSTEFLKLTFTDSTLQEGLLTNSKTSKTNQWPVGQWVTVHDAFPLKDPTFNCSAEIRGCSLDPFPLQTLIFLHIQTRMSWN